MKGEGLTAGKGQKRTSLHMGRGARYLTDRETTQVKKNSGKKYLRTTWPQLFPKMMLR